MNNFVKTILALLIVFFAANANAGVRFLIDSPTHTHRDVLKGDAGIKIKKTCNNRGYNKTECRRNEVALEFCPQNSSYFKYCCPEGFSSTKEECYDAGLEISSTSCHGYYRCETPEVSDEKEDFEYDYNDEYYEDDGTEEEEDYNRRRRLHPMLQTQQIR